MTIGGRCTWETVWSFKTPRFTVKLQLAQDCGYQYDGDDEDGETQAKLDNGEYIAFDSRVVIYCDGREVGADSLGGSVYGRDDYSEFWTAHRTCPADGRNTLAMKARRMCICHYFPDMVRQAVAQARETLCNVPELRCARRDLRESRD